MELAIGNFLEFKESTTIVHRFQNFFIGQDITTSGDTYQFLPFGFSGVTVNTTGDGTDASLLFAQNAISRSWADTAVANKWIAHVSVMILDPDDSTSTSSKLCEYWGQISGGSWDETSLSLTLNTVLDAVKTNVPMRRLSTQLVGDLPTTTNVRLQ